MSVPLVLQITLIIQSQRCMQVHQAQNNELTLMHKDKLELASHQDTQQSQSPPHIAGCEFPACFAVTIGCVCVDKK